MRDNITANKPIRVGIFETVPETLEVTRRLMNAGFTTEQITVVSSDEVKERYFREFEHQDPAGTHTPAAAAVGGFVGAAATGLTVATAAIATGGTALFALGPLIVGTGGIVGGLVGAMMTRGVEKEVADFYDQEVLEGKLLVAVEYHGPDEATKLATAERVISEAGAKPMPLPEG
ncbi:MAG: hypothetical protein AB7O26_16505 [Planctomycetaceae bacterium]